MRCSRRDPALPQAMYLRAALWLECDLDSLVSRCGTAIGRFRWLGRPEQAGSPALLTLLSDSRPDPVKKEDFSHQKSRLQPHTQYTLWLSERMCTTMTGRFAKICR